MPSVIEEIKSRLNIVDIASGYIKLEGAGGNFKALCPFHNEKSPSFLISPSRQTYHCFGCNRGGDIISFVEEIEGLDFSGALKILADRAGVELTRERVGSKELKDEREALYRALELATKYYEAVLPKFPEALTYLKNRGLTDETIATFRVGFAPDEWRALGDFFIKKGVQESVSDKAGLIVKSQKAKSTFSGSPDAHSASRGFYDRFRGRIMFPLSDSSGRIVAFSGRILGTGPGKTLGASADAKYVNSPETEVFHKSRILFGFHNAKDSMRRMDSAVLVEGQMDLILSHQVGVTNAVASSGTAFTAEHLALIKRFTKNIILAFDADDAGLAAAHKGVLLALSQDMSVRIAKLPRGMDPADMALKDPESWKSAIANAQPVIDFYLELLPELYTDKATLRTKVSEVVAPFIGELKSALDQGHYVGRVATLLGIKEEPVWDEVKKKQVMSGIERTAEKLIASVAPLSRRSRIARTIESLLLWQERAKEPLLADVPKYRTLFSELREGAELHEGPPKNHDELIFEAEARFHGNENIEKEIEQLLKNFKEEIIRDRFTEKMERLKKAEEQGNIEEAHKLLAECQAISKELHTLTTKE